MARGILQLGTALAVLAIVIVVAGVFGHSPWQSIREAMYGKPVITKETIAEKKAEQKIVADENRLACLAHLIWHAGWLNGDGNKDKGVLIGVVARNLQEEVRTDMCTIFSKGLVELPEKRTPKTEKSYILHQMEVVTVQKKPTGRSVQYADALEVAQHVESAKDPASLLAPAYLPARCAKHLLRKRFGPLVWWTAGNRDDVREALVAQYGEPVFTASDGTEFFGRCR